MREQKIEQALVEAVKKSGGRCWKFVSPGQAGVPDRIVMLPEGVLAFVELKAPGKKPRPLQLVRHRELAALGFKVYVIDSLEQIGGFLAELKGGDAV